MTSPANPKKEATELLRSLNSAKRERLVRALARLIFEAEQEQAHVESMRSLRR